VKNMLRLCSDESGKDDHAEADAMAGCDGWTEEMDRRGVLRVAAGLRPSSDATTVRAAAAYREALALAATDSHYLSRRLAETSQRP
jgi:hypothetical protein